MKKINSNFRENRRSILTSYMLDVRRVSQKLSGDERIELARRYQAMGDSEAGEVVVYSMLFWVVKLAHFYSRSYGAYPYFLDLVQEGNLGIIVALRKYKSTMGCSFSTYSTLWIKQHMSRFLMNNYSTVRLPVHVQEKLRRLGRTLEKIDQNLTTAERIQAISELDNTLSTNFIERWLSRKHHMLSLDMGTPFDGSEEFATLLDSIPGSDGTEMVEKMCEEELVKKVCSYLRGRFGARALDIIASRLELPGYEPQTLEELGDLYGITRQRVQQIESKILNDERFVWFVQTLLLERKQKSL